MAQLLDDAIQTLLRQAGGNIITPTAYDTAWVAAVPTPDGTAPRFAQSLAWLRAHQHPNGSWGSPWPYYHDRLLSTLRAVLTLHQWGAAEDQAAIAGGLAYIQRDALRWQDDSWETVGFELIFPTLLAEAAAHGLDLPYAIFTPIRRLGAIKRAGTPLHLAYDRRVPLAFSLEALGGAFDPTRVAEIQGADGSVAASPSATAFLLQQCPENTAAAAYLERILRSSGDGSVSVFPALETMERGWMLYQLGEVYPHIERLLPDITKPIFDFLATTARPGGWTGTMYLSPTEGDTTAVCFAALARAGYDLDPQILLQYEEAEYFRCYLFERNISISANAHMLGALRYCPPDVRGPRLDKLLRFFATQRQPGGFWYDKWHVSPYYPTSHIIVAALDLAPDLVAPAITWLVGTQHSAGGWGYYAPTLEETAYAVLALAAWQRGGHDVPAEALERGAAYLQQYWSTSPMAYPPLWISKVLYAPVQIIEAAILAALLAYEGLAAPVLAPRGGPLAMTQEYVPFETGLATGAEASG